MLSHCHCCYYYLVQTTIGGAYCKKDVQVNGWNVSLQIWDTAGQERFRSMAPMYYRNAKAAVLVYDCTDEKTLEKVQGWADGESQSQTESHWSSQIRLSQQLALFVCNLSHLSLQPQNWSSTHARTSCLCSQGTSMIWRSSHPQKLQRRRFCYPITDTHSIRDLAVCCWCF
jgi:GTPase SAR1 family protein